MKRVLAPVIGAVALALALVAPAAANTAHANGTVLTNGTTGTTAAFSIAYDTGKATLVSVLDKKANLRFRSTSVDNIVTLPYVVKMSGMGLANGRAVHFVAIATHHPSPTGDWFKISWGGGPSRGGKLTSGSVSIDALILAVAGGS